MFSICQPCIDAIAAGQLKQAAAKAQHGSNDRNPPQFPSELDHCFILCGDERRGPYLPAQIRTMWKNGSITADSALAWGELTDPVPIAALVNEPRFAHSEASGDGGGNQALTVLGVIMFVGGVIGLFYYWQFFDTSVSVPTERFFGQTLGGGRVHNIGLMQERQNGMIISGIAAAAAVWQRSRAINEHTEIRSLRAG